MNSPGRERETSELRVYSTARLLYDDERTKLVTLPRLMARLIYIMLQKIDNKTSSIGCFCSDLLVKFYFLNAYNA